MRLPEIRDLIVPGEAEEAGLVAQNAFENAAAGASDDAIGELDDLADDARLLAGARLADRADGAAVLVAKRQVVEETPRTN
jgi:hypothetical protein